MEDALPSIGPMPPALWDLLALLGVMLLVAAGLLIWAAFFRRRRKRKQPKLHRRRRTSYREQLHKGASGLKRFVQERRKRRGRRHYAVNPTLAETGGLPPVRSGEPQDTTPSQTR